MDKKSPDAFRTISEVAEWLGVPTHVLRFWESRFAQVKPVKRAGGRRYYRPTDMELLGGIRKLLHDDGMTIRGVQKLLREEGVKHVASMSPPLDEGAMIDVTPSNVVELRKSEPTRQAVEKPAPVEDAVEVTETDETPIDAQPTGEPSAPAAEETASQDVAASTAPETPSDDVPPSLETDPEGATGDEENAPEPLADPSPAAPTQTGFDFGNSALADDLTRDEVLESSEAVEFHSHGTDPAPSPTSGEDASAAPVTDGKATEDYDDPSDLPRLGAGDLPFATGRLGQIEEEGSPSPTAGISEPTAASTTTEGDDTQLSPAPPESEDTQGSDTTAASDSTPGPSPEDEGSPTATPVDISHIPADPEEADISPAGPSLAGRMRRLATRSPQGSAAQMRALGDRLQELSGRMNRDATRRGMQ